MMQELRVGESYPQFKSFQEGVRFQMSDSGAELVILFDNPTTKEIEDVKNGKLQFGLFVKEGIMFLLSKFGFMPWMDSPFHVALASNLTTLQEVGESQGYGCNIILADNRKGEIKAMRYISFNTQFSRALKENIEEQEQENFDKQAYVSTLDYIMRNYTTNDMVKCSIASCMVK